MYSDDADEWKKKIKTKVDHVAATTYVLKLTFIMVYNLLSLSYFHYAARSWIVYTI